MRYRTKLYVAALSVSIVSSILAIGIVELLSRKYLFKFLQNNVSSIAGTTASMLNGDLLKQIREPLDEKKSAYKELQNLLRKARNINRGKEVYIKFLYTNYPDPKDPRKFLFGVDSEENPKDFSPPGSEDPGTTRHRLHQRLHDTFATSKPEVDPWGIWITGYSPVYDSQGNYVGTVGADISASLVQKNLNHLFLFAAVAFTLALLESVIVVMFHANKVTRALKLLESATQEVRKGNYKFRLYLESNDEFQDLGDMMNQMNQWLEENERLKRGFAHYVSQNIVQKLIQEKGSGKIEGQKRKITVLFSHIRDFSQFVDKASPAEVLCLLNDYFKVMLEIIFKYNGMLDKLLGDGIIAEFGMPVEDPEQEKNAILAALEMQKAVASFKNIKIAIGIHTAEAIVGTIDSENKMQYASISNALSVASQMENTLKEEGYPLIVSESTLKAVEGQFVSKKLEPLLIADTGQSILAYAILSPKDPI